MKKFIIPIILIIVWTSSCKKEEDKIAYQTQWSLIDFTKEGLSESYNPNDIIWEFNNLDELIVTVNTDLTNSHLPIKTSGTYEYVGTPRVVSIKRKQYAVNIDVDTLFLSRNAATGIGTIIKFLRLKK